MITEFIREQMDVIASDGHRIGRVAQVAEGQIELDKSDRETGLKPRIPVTWVDHIDQHVHLNVTGDEAKSRWTTN